jgi:hypothetical protein
LDGADPAGTGTPPANGATVSTWVDKATGKNATATGTPTYLSGGGINFTASPYFLNQTFSMNLSQRSIFIVMQETSRNTGAGVIPFIPTPSSGSDYNTTGGFSIETASGLRFLGNYGGSPGSYLSALGNTNLLVKAIYNDTMNVRTGSGYLNGTNTTNVTADYTASTCSGYVLGGRWELGSVFGSYRLNGVIYEVIVFNTALTTSQRQQVEGYLAHKWGLTSSLPSKHPYIPLPPIFPPATTQPASVSYSASEIITANLIVNLDPLSYTSGTSWPTTVGNTWTFSSAPTIVSTSTSSALSFNGSQYVTGPQISIGPASTNIFTIEIWFNAPGNSTNNLITERNSGWDTTMMYLQNNIILAAFWNGSPYSVSMGSYTANTWTQACYTYSGTTVTCYKNGVYVAGDTTTKQYPNYANYLLATTGYPINSNTATIIGGFRMYSTALSATQVKENYNAYAPRFGLSTIT